MLRSTSATATMGARMLVLAVLACTAFAQTAKQSVPLGDNYFGLARTDPTTGDAYKGSFDIKSAEYMKSCLAVAIPGFAIAILMIVLMSLMLAIRIVSLMCGLFCKCCQKAFKPLKYNNTSLKIMKVAILLFTLIAVTGCLLIYVGGPKLTTAVGATTDVMILSVKKLSDNVTIISDVMESSVGELDDKSLLTTVKGATKTLKDALSTVDKAMTDNKKKLKEYMDLAALGFMAVAAVIAFIAILGCLTGVMGWTKLLLLTIILGSVLLILNWIMMGLCSVMLVVVDDLCKSIEGYLVDPSTSSLDSIIPCLDEATAVDTMNTARELIYKLIQEVNSNMLNAYTTAQGSTLCDPLINPLAIANPCTFPPLNFLCEIYAKTTKGSLCSSPSTYANSPYTQLACNSTLPNSAVVYPAPATCPYPTTTHLVTLTTFATAFAPFECKIASPTQTQQLDCFSKGQLFSPSLIISIDLKLKAVDRMVKVLPMIESIILCDFVVVAFSDLTDGECDDLVAGLALVWQGFTVSGIMYFLLWVTWQVAYSRYNNPEKNTDNNVSDLK